MLIHTAKVVSNAVSHVEAQTYPVPRGWYTYFAATVLVPLVSPILLLRIQCYPLQLFYLVVIGNQFPNQLCSLRKAPVGGGRLSFITKHN